LVTFALRTSQSMADGTSGDEKVVEVVVGAEIQMLKQYLHHLPSRSVEQN